MNLFVQFYKLPIVLQKIIKDYYFSLVFYLNFKPSLQCFKILPLDIDNVQGYLHTNKFYTKDLARIGNAIDTVLTRQEKIMIIHQVFDFFIDKHWWFKTKYNSIQYHRLINTIENKLITLYVNFNFQQANIFYYKIFGYFIQ